MLEALILLTVLALGLVALLVMHSGTRSAGAGAPPAHPKRRLSVLTDEELDLDWRWPR